MIVCEITEESKGDLNYFSLNHGGTETESEKHLKENNESMAIPP